MNGTLPVGVDWKSTRHTSTPKGCFVLRADTIRPYGVWYDCSGRAVNGSLLVDCPD